MYLFLLMSFVCSEAESKYHTRYVRNSLTGQQIKGLKRKSIMKRNIKLAKPQPGTKSYYNYT